MDESGSLLFTLGYRAPDDFPARLLASSNHGPGDWKLDNANAER